MGTPMNWLVNKRQGQKMFLQLSSSLITLATVFAFCRSGHACAAGFTGQACDIPVCTKTGSVFPPSGHTNYGFLVNGESLLNCDLPGFNAAFYVDAHSTTITIDVLASGGNPKVLVHSNQTTDFKPDRVLQTSASRVVEQFDSLNDGSYVAGVSFSKPVGCVVQISAQTNLTVSLSFAPNAIHSDDGYSYLPDSVASNILVHVAGIQSPGNASTVVIYQSGSFLDRLSLTARSNCAYEYYTPMDVKCERLHTYYVEIFGSDEKGNRWMRSAQVPCIGPAGR
uniref:MD domain-containing protein n=1 Tax=Plectus sambesii TaxID=2011161 RepID=A0A914X386_9BILA